MNGRLMHRFKAAVSRLTGRGGGDGDGGGNESSAACSDPAIIAYDDLISVNVGKLKSAADKIGGHVSDVTNVVAEAFNVQKELLVKTMQSQKPDMGGIIEFLEPLNEVIMKAEGMRERKRSEFSNHLNAAADSLRALLWIGYTGKDCGLSMPIAHVEDSWQMAEFYSNKVLVEFRNKDANHVEWAKALKELYISCLRDYVKSHYPLGPVWSSTGKANLSTPTKAPNSGAPAPPAPAAALFSSNSAQPSPSRSKDGMSAVFQEINSGKPVTSGLRKVTDDMKTKNRSDKTGVVPVVEKESRSSMPSNTKTLPPKFELQMGRKWAVENQIGRKDLVVNDCDSKQTVYVFGCKDSVLQIQGKINNITIDKCTKTGIVFKDVVAACEVVNCNGIDVQCQGSAPTISVDNTSGCQLYLSKDSLKASITTAKSSEINVFVPGASPDDDWEQHSLPQQYIHKYKDERFVTNPVLQSAG
ncbi:actin or actin-binding cytoskeletal protein [Lithospermum erythrorhizon]|uniref:Actin or actin-binding cytoskeletal protein n=1 Tax=Lithospermum erythrorhizon TaxID=34254 RepID=A0AAV3P549_LITER